MGGYVERWVAKLIVHLAVTTNIQISTNICSINTQLPRKQEVTNTLFPTEKTFKKEGKYVYFRADHAGWHHSVHLHLQGRSGQQATVKVCINTLQYMHCKCIYFQLIYTLEFPKLKGQRKYCTLFQSLSFSYKIFSCL
jgi:hypothetical protein